MRLKTENEELRHACKKGQQGEPRGPASASFPSSPEPDSFLKSSSALARVRARRSALAGSRANSFVEAEK